MAIHEIPTPSTPQKAMTGLFSRTNYANQNSPPISSSHTFSESMMQENIENSETMISKWDPSSPSMERFVSLFQENRKEAKEFVNCVKDLRRAMHFLIAEHSNSNKLVLAHKLMKIAMQRLEKEFFQILSANREYLNPESVPSQSSRLSRSLSAGNSEDGDEEEYVGSEEDDVQVSKVERAVSDLKLIAESMISSGYSKECMKIYKITRKSILDEEIYRLGIQNYSSSQINRMNAEILEHQINKWIEAAKIGVRALFRGERFLCDHIFATSETIKQTCIAHITLEVAINLFKFPEIVTKSKRLPDKIFHLMNMYETISDLWPEIESIFSYEPLSAIRLQALSSLHKLSDSVQTILSEFVSSIQKNSSKTTITGGGIHPLTCSVMNYVSLLADNSGVLTEILAENQENIAQSPFPESYFDSPTPSSSVASRLAWIILVLLCKLDSKAKLYNDIALYYLFLANNIQFVIEKVSTTSLKFLLGEDWLSKLQKKVKLYATNYEAVAWCKAFSCLPLPAENLVAEMSPDTIKERVRQFNSAFEDAYRKQSSWVVPDSKLRDEIKVSIASKLVPTYREFYDSYLAILSKEKNFEVLVRFSPDNLGNYLSDLFHKTAISGNSSSSSAHSRMSRCL